MNLRFCGSGNRVTLKIILLEMPPVSRPASKLLLLLSGDSKNTKVCSTFTLICFGPKWILDDKLRLRTSFVSASLVQLEFLGYFHEKGQNVAILTLM